MLANMLSAGEGSIADPSISQSKNALGYSRGSLAPKEVCIVVFAKRQKQSFLLGRQLATGRHT